MRQDGAVFGQFRPVFGKVRPGSLRRASARVEGAETALKRALRLARTVGPRLRSAKDAFFVTVSRRDGAFGLSGEVPTSNPLAGGLAGLAKTAAHEWPEVRCRALDVSGALDDAQAASAIVEELTQDGPREVGLGPAGRLTLATREQVGPVSAPALTKGDVVVVTGGARGVTAECARELAQQTGATLLLLGRSPVPDTEPAWLAQAQDEAAVKRALLEHAPAGERPTPRVLGERCHAVLAAREIRAGLDALTKAGLTAHYRSVDVRDQAALSQVLAQARTTMGVVRGVVHGAGVLRDRRIEDKRDEDFDQVLDPKLAGARALLAATASDDLRVVAFFASVTGRFGRRGQSDYAVANQALVSIAQAEAARRRDCRVVAFDWGPWDGGMVTPALKAEFQKEGVALLPLLDGARAFCAELGEAPGSPVEVVVGAGFGDEPAAAWAVASVHQLDPAWPVLAAHRLAGRPVLPLAMTLELFAQAFPGSVSLEEVRVLKGVALEAGPETVTVWRGLTAGGRTPVELRGQQDQVFVRAVAVTDERPRPQPLALPGALRPLGASMATAYAEQLFHGPALHALDSVEGVSEQGMTLHLRTHRTSEQLVPGPARAWRTDPLAVDGVFQALILWCRAQKGAPSLPSRLGAWRQFAALGPGVVKGVVRIREADAATVLCDVDLLDAGGQVAARLEGYACTISPSLDRAFAGPGQPAATVGPTA